MVFFVLFAQVTLNFLSMDVGPNANNYSKRREILLEKLKILDADVLCLQGVWDDKNIYSNYLEHSFTASSSVKDTVSRPCSIRNWNWKCILDNCPGADRNCAKKQCPMEDKCIKAILSLDNSNFLVRLLKVYNPLINKYIYPYQGSSGVLLLSKYPLSNITTIDFSKIDSLYNYSGVSADLELADATIRITCNELPEDYSKYSDLAKQILKFKTSGRNVFMGKFNFNPNKVFKFKNYYAEVIGSCDYCADNNFNSKDDTKNYILLKDLEASKIDQILKEEVTIDGQPTNLSPHYPQMVQIIFKDKV